MPPESEIEHLKINLPPPNHPSSKIFTLFLTFDSRKENFDFRYG
jgi:hypothetical protein